MAKTRDYMDYLDERIGIAPAFSQEECQAGEVISRIMRDHGLQTSVEEFDGRGSGTVARNVLVIVMFIAALMGGFAPDVLHIVLVLVALAAAAILAFMHFVRNVFEDLGPSHRSQNVVGLRRATAENVMRGSRPIVIVAHYDTPRDSVMRRGALAHYQSTLVRVAAVCPAVVAVALVFQVMMFLPDSVRIFMWVVSLMASVPSLFVAVMSIMASFGECTLGSNDNKAAVAALLGMVDKVSPAEDHASDAAKQRPSHQRRRRADAPPEPTEPQVRRVTVVEEVYGVRHGEDVLRGVGILPPSCEIVYEEPKVTVTEEPLDSWGQSETVEGVDETSLDEGYESDYDYEPDDVEGDYDDDEFGEGYDADYDDDTYEDDGYEDDSSEDDDFDDMRYDSDYDDFEYEEEEEEEFDSGNDEFGDDVFDAGVESREEKLALVPSLDMEEDVYDDEPDADGYYVDEYDDEYLDDEYLDDEEYDEEYEEEYDDGDYVYDDEEDDDYTYDDEEEDVGSEDEYDDEYDDEETLDEADEDGYISDEDELDYEYEDELELEEEEEEEEAEESDLDDGEDAANAMGSAIGSWFSKRFQAMKEFLTYDDDETGSGGWIDEKDGASVEEKPVEEEPVEGEPDESESVEHESAEVADEDQSLPSDDEESYGAAADEAYDNESQHEAERRPFFANIPRIEDEPGAELTTPYEDDPDAMADLAFDAERQQGYYEDDFEYEEDESSYYDSFEDAAAEESGEEQEYYEDDFSEDDYSEEEYYEEEYYEDDESYEDEDLTGEGYLLDEDSEEYDDEGYLLDEDLGEYEEEEYEEEQTSRRSQRKEKKPSFAQRILGVFGGGRRERAAKREKYEYEDEGDEEDYEGDDYYLEDDDALGSDYEVDDQESSYDEDEYEYQDEDEYVEEEEYIEDDGYLEDDEYYDDEYLDEDYEIEQDQFAEEPQRLADPNSLHFDRDEDDDIVARDDSGLNTISDSYDLYTGDVSRESQRARPASIEDPTWGTSTYQPTRPAINIARRAALYDLPDPSGNTVDPLADEFEYDEDVLATSDEAGRSEARGGFWGEGAGNPRSQAWKGGATMREDIRQDEMVGFEGELQDAMLELGDDFLDQHDIWFVATGASEQDHAGMKAFLDAHRKEIRGAFLVNLECVGAGSLAVYVREGLSDRRRADRRLVKMASDIARDLHIGIDTAMCDWTETDAAVAMRSRVRAMSIVGLDENDLPALSHTLDDVPENVSPSQVDDVVRVVTEIIRRA